LPSFNSSGFFALQKPLHYPSVEILINASALINKDGKILLSLKTQSISQQSPHLTLKKVEEKFNKRFKIISKISLEPYHKKHYFFMLKKK
jgi:fibrillarin-like rRNA methylase